MATPSRISSMPAADFENMLNDWRRVSRKDRKNWSWLTQTSHGTRQKITVKSVAVVDGMEVPMFVCQRNGLLTFVAPDTQVVRGHLPVLPQNVSPEEFRREVAANQTGNHRPRNHPVRVPTQAGEPVRG